jgi:hypothetical protein
MTGWHAERLRGLGTGDLLRTPAVELESRLVFQKEWLWDEGSCCPHYCLATTAITVGPLRPCGHGYRVVTAAHHDVYMTVDGADGDHARSGDYVAILSMQVRIPSRICCDIVDKSK